MSRNTATGVWRSSALLGLAACVSVALAGCASIDEALFGPSGPEATNAGGAPGTLPGDNGAAPAAQGETAPPPAETAPPPSEGEVPAVSEGTLPDQAGAPPPESMPAASGTYIRPVQIEPGTDTGTAVSHTIQQLRSSVADLQNKLVSDGQRFAQLKGQAMQSTASYNDAKARITTRLQVGTTRGNPELVGQWNNAQSALDSLTANINAMNALGTEIANDSSRAHYALDTIQSTFNVSGAVDEDHRQLRVLQEETEQTIVLIDRLMMDVSDRVQRQTGYVASERASLTTLASAIKNGELFGTDLGMMPPAAGPATGEIPGGAPLVTIRFDRANVNYKQTLYTALSQALQSRPGASFTVVAVSPTRGSAAAVQLAQSRAQRHAAEVMHAMTDMGVPGTRLGLTSTTDPTATASEVRVYVR